MLVTLSVYDGNDKKGERLRVNRILGLMCSFILSAATVIGLMMNAVFESFNPARLGAYLVLLILLHLVLCPRLLFTRELMLYLIFYAYMGVSLLWAPSVDDGMNTLLPATNFLLIMILLCSLIAFHNLRSVVAGNFVGFLCGAVFYTSTVGFPFVFPPEFSYNAIAMMYLCGLFSTLVFGWLTHSRLVPLLVSLVIMIHIAATTSIKTNLGIILGVSAAGLIYVRRFIDVLWRNIVPVSILAAALVYAIASNDALLERVQTGLDRVSHGVDILQRREDVDRNTSFGERADWKDQGVKGWMRSPLFGNGVEAFRTDYGITSHSTPIDLLYNTGVIGFAVFYAIFVSLGVRLAQVRGLDLGGLPALIFAGLICYSFITLSGTMHYNSFMAVFFAASSGLLRRQTASLVHSSSDVVETFS